MKYTDIFFDVDYTLIDFERDHQEAIRQISKSFSLELAKGVDQCFYVVLEGLRVKDDDWSRVPGGKAQFDFVINRMKELQNTGTPRIWSRELFGIIAAEELGTKLSQDEAINLGEVYWSRFTHDIDVYSDAKACLSKLNRSGISYHLFTSSDARLTWREYWRYDPDYSMRKKEKRIVALQEGEILPVSVTIGDPDDKPQPRFYQRMLETARGKSGNMVDPQKCLIVGDSFEGDVHVPVSQGIFGYGCWVDRGGHPQQISDRIMKVSSVLEIPIE